MSITIENKHLPKGAKNQIPNHVVVHSMSEYIEYEGETLHAYDFLKKIGLSAHALICPDGTIIKCREDNQGAYHAKGFNTNSLGIEFLVRGVHDYVGFKKTIKTFYLTFDQHVAGVELLRDWCSKHDIKSIDKHSTLSPDRKVDPGQGFPWEQFLIDVKAGGKS